MTTYFIKTSFGPLLEKTNIFYFPTSSDTNRPVLSQKQARSLKFWIYVEEELHCMCSENKDADQLCSYTAQLICAFVFAYACCWFSYAAAHFRLRLLILDLFRQVDTAIVHTINK